MKCDGCEQELTGDEVDAGIPMLTLSGRTVEERFEFVHKELCRTCFEALLERFIELSSCAPERTS